MFRIKRNGPKLVCLFTFLTTQPNWRCWWQHRDDIIAGWEPLRYLQTVMPLLVNSALVNKPSHLGKVLIDWPLYVRSLFDKSNIEYISKIQKDRNKNKFLWGLTVLLLTSKHGCSIIFNSFIRMLVFSHVLNSVSVRMNHTIRWSYV